MRRIPLAVILAAATATSARLPPAGAVPQSAVVALDPASGPPTSAVTVSGSGFGTADTVVITMAGRRLGTAATDPSGSFSTQVTIPRRTPPGNRAVNATGDTSGLTASAVFLVRTDWPHFRFDQGHTGVNPFENVLTPANVPRMQLDWQAQLGQPVYSSSPAVVDGVVYVGGYDGTLWAFDAHGCGGDFCETPLWTGFGGPQILSSPAVANGVVYVGNQASPNSNDGRLSAYAAGGCGRSSCSPLWKGRAGPESILDSSPAVAGGVVYVGSFDDKLYAFDADGCGRALCDPLWVGPTGGPIESSPTVVGGVVYIGSNDGKLYAFAAGGCGQTSCSPLWTGSTGSPIYASSPAVARGVVYVAADHYLGAFAAGGCGRASCPPLWKGEHQPDFFYGSPAVFRGRVFVGLENGLGVFDAGGCGQALCQPEWIAFGSGAQAAVVSSPAVAGGVVFAGRNTGQVLAWKAAGCGAFICSEIWTGFTRDPVVSSSPTVVDGRLYVGSSDNLFPFDISGRLYVFDIPRNSSPVHSRAPSPS
jgi:outer membrane protein assembly factor BamB